MTQAILSEEKDGISYSSLKEMAKEWKENRKPFPLKNSKGEKIGEITNLYVNYKTLWGDVKEF